MSSLRNKTVLITGATRGIGKAIALKAASLGAQVVVTGKTKTPHPHLEGTLEETVKAIEAQGGKALPIVLDIRFKDQIEGAVQKTVDTFGGLDILVNNASAIRLLKTEELDPKTIDLMLDINVKGTLFMSKACIPHLRKGKNSHIVMLSPPLDLTPYWFQNHMPYTLSKYAMSMVALGLAQELKAYGIAVNTLWPQTTIATAALKMLGGAVPEDQCRRPDIVADAACLLFQEKASCVTGHHFTDEGLLREKGMVDFKPYAVNPEKTLITDLFLTPSPSKAV